MPADHFSGGSVMVAIGRRGLILGVSALALMGCNGAGGGTAASPDDMVLGAENAPVTIIEYASVTCPHCAEFHEAVWEQLKTTYIDTGRVRFIFREFPTPPPQVAVAGFQLARCGGATPEQYFTRVGELFRQQQAMFASGSMEGVRAKMIEIGGAAGLSEQQVTECIADQGGAERVRRIMDASDEFGITGTPTIIINGQKAEGTDVVTWEGLSRRIEEALGS
jgi:protein-disulfide isomerase